MRYSHHMNKQLTFLLSLTLLFLVGCKTVGVNDNQSKDYTEEVRLHRLSAEQGNVKGQINLGVMYFNGHGVQQDYKEAVKWFRLSADQGFSLGQYNLGVMYTNGQGVSVNYLLAYKWFNLSAANGNENANFYRNKLEEVMSQSQIKKAQEMARNWKPETR